MPWRLSKKAQCARNVTSRSLPTLFSIFLVFLEIQFFGYVVPEFYFTELRISRTASGQRYPQSWSEASKDWLKRKDQLVLQFFLYFYNPLRCAFKLWYRTLCGILTKRVTTQYVTNLVLHSHRGSYTCLKGRTRFGLSLQEDPLSVVQVLDMSLSRYPRYTILARSPFQRTCRSPVFKLYSHVPDRYR